ncbi:hypothetical protein [Amycolatopsis sp. FDAARGOS 1241]|uniref:hypothetical protein n=1 Tax=Amycolatopsis sp. FDAARGOS 1241 TaxID=2778070 RepID=UPI001951ABC7|nr:hypothetical protein [Amycolatopsis sp. FDAARGOS 1241]QRP43010.1 hypothetical protein I6J71_26605 [Amycolatopsis sp. FDAARGOS 1241]
MLRHAARDNAGHPLCNSTLRIVVRSKQFGPPVGGTTLQTCPRCAALAAGEPNAGWS